DEFNDDFLAYIFEVPVSPLLKRVSRGCATALVHRPVVGSTRRVRLDLICRSIHYVDPAAVGLPTWDACCVVLVRVRNTPIMLFFEFVFRSVRGRIAARPECLNELITFFVV